MTTLTWLVSHECAPTVKSVNLVAGAVTNEDGKSVTSKSLDQVVMRENQGRDYSC